MGLKTQAKLKRKNLPYLYQFFNVFGYFQSSVSAVKGLARILNAFIEGLNNRPRLPKYVVMVPDRDLIAATNYYGFGVSLVFKETLTWVIKQMDANIQRRKTQLFDKKPGALFIESLKFIWIKMIKQPYNGMQRFDQIMALRNRFNNTLEEVLAANTTSKHFILSIKAEEEDFYWMGELTDDGKLNFWKEVDACLRRFDWGEINLRPRTLTLNKTNNNDNSCLKYEFPRHKLPTPPNDRRKKSARTGDHHHKRR